MRLGLLSMVAVIFTAAIGTAAPAHAVEYQYWSYWRVSDGAWKFSGVGPASTKPMDGDVEGWRFAITGVNGRVAPAADPATAFDSACADVAPPPPDAKRVALVLDPGAVEDAPEGTTPPALATRCVVISADASGYDVLTANDELRTERGFVCAIDEYPPNGCGDVIESKPSRSSESASLSSSPSASSTPSPSMTRATQIQSPSAQSPSADATSQATSPAADTPSASAAPIAAREDEPSSSFPWIPTVIVIGILAVGALVFAVRRR